MKDTLRLFAVRGAVCCKNTTESIDNLVPLLYAQLLQKNSIEEDSIVSIMFSVTNDLTEQNPATALRKKNYALSVPLFTSLEPSIKDALPFVIRVLITFYGYTKPEPVYCNGAEILRPDLFKI